MDLLTRILINKYKNKSGGGGSGGSSINLFIQNDQPEGYDGIWIKSDSLGISNIVEVADKNSLVASSINIVKGTAFETILFDSDVENGVHYKFSEIIFTDSNNAIIYDIPTYYGNGQSWIEITKKSVVELEYIESNGNQYIDTGIKASSNLNIYADIKPNANSERTLFGLKADENGNRLSVFKYYNEQVYYYTAKNGFSYYSDNAFTNRKMFNANKNKLIVDGTLKITADGSSFTSTKSIYIFAGNNNGSVIEKSSFKLYSFTIYDNDILVRDFIPAKDTNEVVCLYDNVSKQFFYNQGTGTFIAGPEV